MDEKYFTFPFTQDVPFKLIETGSQKTKPLIIYLHGYKQNIRLFEKKITKVLSFKAHHLLLQGPYPIYDENRRYRVENWGRAWYLYDGRQDQFKKSMEKSSKLIDGIIEKISASVSYSSVTIFGYSMGAYLAGYFALSRPEVVDNLITIGGRIKTEWFTGKNFENLNVLALHGLRDESVKAAAAGESSKALQKMGASVHFKTPDEGHRLSETYIEEAKEWLESI